MANIYPNFSRFESREKKERQLYQQGFTLWFTGLSGSGKSIVAAELERLMTENGHFVTVLDGDNLRFGWHFPVSGFWKDTFHPAGSRGNVDGCPGE